MRAFLINEKEVCEMEYLIKREMDEILFDLSDERIENVVKRSMRERYKILFSLFRIVALPSECMRYMPVADKRGRKKYN
ncbi:hypothetical protein [Bacillus massilinigeriensis]|uniref:hypothetical protein n=1 Tax=Bacillus mediterraneensis TaxID=1805474 RepID=UPI0008F8CAF2|nr:hypothetical protein [Bacillus mediterraneensis]